jgi:hypothetical protein
MLTVDMMSIAHAVPFTPNASDSARMPTTSTNMLMTM